LAIIALFGGGDVRRGAAGGRVAPEGNPAGGEGVGLQRGDVPASLNEADGVVLLVQHAHPDAGNVDATTGQPGQLLSSSTVASKSAGRW
jgi:hypothetical protein